jgi:hypothetical protein
VPLTCLLIGDAMEEEEELFLKELILELFPELFVFPCLFLVEACVVLGVA